MLVAAELFALPAIATAAGGGLTFLGAVCFVANTIHVIDAHSPHSIPGVLFETFRTNADPAHED